MSDIRFSLLLKRASALVFQSEAGSSMMRGK